MNDESTGRWRAIGLAAALAAAGLGVGYYRSLSRRLVAGLRREAALKQVARELGASLSLRDAVQTIVRRAVASTRAFGAYIERAESPEPGTEVEIVAIAGRGVPPLGTRIPYPGSLSEEIIESGEPQLLTDIGAIGERMAPYLRTSCRSCSGLVIPLSSEGKVLGALILLRGQGQPQFSSAEVGYARTLGDLASTALRRLLLLEALAESEIRFRQIADHLHEVIWLGDPDLTERYYVNPAYETVWGRSRESFYQEPRSPLEAVHPEDRARVEAALPEIRNGSYDLQYRIIRPDGGVRWIWSRIYPIRNDQGEVYRVAGIMEDITDEVHAEQERRRANERLRESERNFRVLGDSIPQLTWMANARGGTFWYNKRWYEYTGSTPDEMRATGWPKLVHPEYVRRVVQGFRRAFEQGEPWEDTYPLRSKTGEYRWFLSRAVPVKDEQGRVLRWFGTNTDVTEREQLHSREREARAEAERRWKELERITESRTRLMRGFSHDLKNPLGAADGHAALLEEGILGELSERQRESVGRIRSSIHSALRLIHDLLELARAETGQLEIAKVPTDVAAVAREAAEDFRAPAEAAGLTLEVRAPDGLSTVSDPARVRQVLGNLLSNAVKYTSRGRVTVSVEAHSDGPRPGEWVAVAVADTGPGIAPEQQARVFQEFARLESSAPRGTGVGLAISRRIARLLGGEITLRSAPGQGSTFTLWLPR